jgi:FG-GAP repeat
MSGIGGRTTRWILGMMAVALLLAAAAVWAPWAVPAPRPVNRQVPAAAAASISGVLGAQEPAYRVASSSGEPAARSGALTERFGNAGVMLRFGPDRLGLGLVGWGRADRVQRPGLASPSVVRNRVTYRYPGGEQWFANGPLGLEQGFTIKHAPVGEGPLRLALGVSGNVSVSGHGAAGLTLSDSAGARLTYSGLTAFDATGRRLRATLAASGQRITISVADRGARYPIVVDPFIQLAKLVDPVGLADGRLGDSVAMAGNTIFAAEAKDGQSDAHPTEIDVFVEPSSGWGGSGALVATLSAGTPADDFGGMPSSLSISSDGSAVVVGAPDTEVGANAEQGVAYVFQRPPGGWSGALGPSATLKISGGSNGDRFGSSVAISPDGTTVVIGVPQEGSGDTGDGQVDVYIRGSSWASSSTPSAVLTDSSLSGAELGSAVGIGGTTIAATAPNANATTGQTDVFVRPGSSWQSTSTPSAELEPDGSTSDDNFGHDLAISSSGNLIAVGAPNRGQNQGAVYVYQLSAPAWQGHVSQSATLLGPTGTASGAGGALAISGTTVLAGASFATIDNQATAGAGYVYAESATGWQNTSTPDATLSASDPAMGSGAGSSVAMSNGIAVLGAPTTTVNGADLQGALYVFGSQPVTTIALSPASPNGLAGWYTMPVTVSVSASDPFSSVTATNCVLDPASAPSTFTTIPVGCSYTGAGAAVSTDGTHTLYAASENATGTAEPPRGVTVKIDRTPPSLVCAGYPSFQLGSSGGLVSASVTDGDSGPAAQTVSARASTASFGKKSVTLQGADIAGNTATKTCPYSVTAPGLNPSPTMKWVFVPAKSFTTIKAMSIAGVPAAASVKVLCSGKGCPFSSRSVKPAARQQCTGKGKHRTCKAAKTKPYDLSLGGLFHGRHLGAGAKVTVEISQPGRIGKAYVFTFRASRQPTSVTACLAPGSTSPGSGCP